MLMRASVVQVRARNDAGWGSFCAPVSASTSGECKSWGMNAEGQLGGMDFSQEIMVTTVRCSFAWPFRCCSLQVG